MTMTPRLLAALIAAIAAAALGVGIGIGAAIWEGGSSPPAADATAAAANATASWLFVVTADAGVVTATGGDELTIELRGTAPRAVAFTDCPQREAKAVKTPILWAALYANGSTPPNAALSFDHAGEAVVVPLEMLNVTGAAPNYTVAARAGGLLYLAAEMVECLLLPQLLVPAALDRPGLQLGPTSFLCVAAARARGFVSSAFFVSQTKSDDPAPSVHAFGFTADGLRSRDRGELQTEPTDRRDRPTHRARSAHNLAPFYALGG